METACEPGKPAPIATIAMDQQNAYERLCELNDQMRTIAEKLQPGTMPEFELAPAENVIAGVSHTVPARGCLDKMVRQGQDVLREINNLQAYLNWLANLIGDVA